MAEVRTLSNIGVVIRVSRHMSIWLSSSSQACDRKRNLCRWCPSLCRLGPQCIDHVLVCAVGYPSQITAFASLPSPSLCCPPHIPTQSMCFKQSGNGNIPLLIHAHTYSFLLCSDPYRTWGCSGADGCSPYGSYTVCYTLSSHFV